MTSENKKAPHFAGAVAGMSACYAISTFTDNYYKQCAILLAASLQMTSMQSMATVLFALPFIIFSAWAGWLADRASKKYLVLAVNILKLLLLIIGVWALTAGHWTSILAVIFVMGSLSTFFGPAINGSIPEHFSLAQVPKANACIRMASTTAILGGIALAGLMLDTRPAVLTGMLGDMSQLLNSLTGTSLPQNGMALGRFSAALFLASLAVLGVLSALTLRSCQPSAMRTSFPWLGPVASIRHVLECRNDKALLLVLLSEAGFSGIATVMLISVANLSTDLGYSNTMAGLLSAMLTVGIALGAVLGGRGTAESWRVLMVPAGSAMGICLILTALTPYVPATPLAGVTVQHWWILAMLLICGIFGGLYLIPLVSFMQVRPPSHLKGRIQGVSNFLSFTSMAVFGALFEFIGDMPPAWTFVLYGVLALGYTCFWTKRRIRDLSCEEEQKC